MLLSLLPTESNSERRSVTLTQSWSCVGRPLGALPEVSGPGAQPRDRTAPGHGRHELPVHFHLRAIIDIFTVAAARITVSLMELYKYCGLVCAGFD